MSQIFFPKYCDTCGGILKEPDFVSLHDPPLVCTVCGRRVFLDPKLAVASVLEHEGRIVLLRRAQRDAAHGLWIMPGGHVDRGEVVPVAAEREVYEETGLEPVEPGSVPTIPEPGVWALLILLSIILCIWNYYSPFKRKR